jgi:hypothetical protein
MAAGTFDIALEQGTTFRLRLTWGTRGPDGPGGTPTLGGPYDLTGCTARMQVRPRAGGDVLLTLASGGGGLVLGGTAGTIDIVITDEQTDAITVKRAKYDLKVTFPGGDERRVVQGAIANSLTITTDA